MADDELLAFRENWKRELTDQTQQVRTQNQNPTETASCANPESSSTGNRACDGEAQCAAEPSDQPKYVSIASGLLDGRTSPLLDRIQEERMLKRRRYHDSIPNTCSGSSQQPQPQKKAQRGEKLVDQLIQDLV